MSLGCGISYYNTSIFVQHSTHLKRSLPHYVKTSLFFMFVQCDFPLEKDNKLKQAPSSHEMTHEYLIRQASTSTISATQQLLTLTFAAISDTSKMYRECMEQLMSLMDQSLQVQSAGSAHSELWDQVIEMRMKVRDCKQRLEELTSFMEYVDKLATSAAETAYLGGAEHMSTVMCETMNSAHAKLALECDKTRDTENEFLKQQENFIRRTCELEEGLKGREKATEKSK
ncbi:uncharacterized protein LOC110828094 isoform X2 [Zootermopsis nevadensis]|uniref:uncharacterized protein LOC110828094 isoform X2 n=1 Tax=Zootermopsis nevadensis TaxID=136037 RepID=UPI000B8E74D7|nr:uncharacterized protein LOC110828094 isoform X2 [Zootermopsis nevadensis]